MNLLAQCPAFVYLLMSLFASTQLSSATDCFSQSADIVFAVDSSFSIRSQDFRRQLTFLRALIDNFPVGPHSVQVGVVSFATEVHPDIKLNDFNTSREIKEAVKGIVQMDKGTETDKAIRFIHTHMFTPEYGSRPWAKKLIILVTDGLSQNSSQTLLEATIARSKHIEIFSVGVGDQVEDFEIYGVASEPKTQHVFRVDNYEALAGIEKSLSSVACELPQSDGPVGKPADIAIRKCLRNNVDVIFLMDTSNSIWKPDFQRQIKFIEKVTSRFFLGPTEMRVGVVTYSDTPMTLLALNELQTHQHIRRKLGKASYITGKTNTALALNHARRHFHTHTANSAHVARFIVALTDGESDSVKATIEEADRAKEEGIRIFTVGIGSKSKAEDLMAFASQPSDRFVLRVDDYKSLRDIDELLAIKTCDVASSLRPPTKCPSSPMDLVFVYDTNALTPQHHRYIIGVISDVTEANGLNSSDLRVGVLREASALGEPGLHDIELTNQWDRWNFKHRLEAYESRRASIFLLLQKARHKYFPPTFQYEVSSHKKVVVLFVDSVLDKELASNLEAMRLRKSGVTIIVVSVGKYYKKLQLHQLASHPISKYILNSPSARNGYHKAELVSKLIQILCE
ncbi:cartilage matrix protein [Aplysia californica]|uniref:Cartilage matrix protein n=1 Tax=Aplysia californica TaxID=6500 RepID=A0ABM0JJ78_APLCA|nr:cartilage matrix protein [Aplysia californica]XP_005094886.1 cartilage matrix protein [Aplysia californica]